MQNAPADPRIQEDPCSGQQAWFKQLHACLSACRLCDKGSEISLEQGFDRFAQYINTTRANKGTVWLLGNGGSIATCSHMAQDMMNCLNVRTETLSHGPLITCISNDYSFDEIFLKPLQTLANPHDTLIVLSCSGESKNVINAAWWAKEHQINLVTLTAMKSTNCINQMKADLSFWVPTRSFGIAEVAHHAILHNYVETLTQTEKTKTPKRNTQQTARPAVTEVNPQITSDLMSSLN